MKKKALPILYTVLSAAAAVLNTLPTAVKMRFAGPDQYFYEYCSGYDLLPIGYGIWGPMLGGVAAIVLVILGVCVLIKPRVALKRWMLALTAFGWIMCISPTLLGMQTVTGVIISTLLAVQLLLLAFDKDNVVKKT